METPNLDHAGGHAYRPLTAAFGPALGYPASTNSVRELRDADVILLFGADITETHPIAKNEVIAATGRKKARPIVVDAIQTKLTERMGSLFLQVPPGTEYLIANAMLKFIIDQDLVDKKVLDLRADGFDELVASLGDYTVECVAGLTGVSADLITEAAKAYVEAENAAIVLTAGMNRMGNTVELAQAALNLALVTGRVGKRSGGVHFLGEKANSQGALDMGLAPDLLPGFYRIEDEAARAKFSQAWDAPIPEAKGLCAREMLAKAESGEIRGLYVVGENPVESYPDREQVEKALKSVEFLVVQDMFMTSTAKLAHAVLPVASFVEKSGTYTSTDRRVQRLTPALKNTAAKSDMEIFTALAAMMGKPSLTYAGPERVMEEIAGLVDVYAGIAYGRLGTQGLVWPCVDAEDPGKELLYEGGFLTGKAHLVPAPALPEPSANGLPMYLIPAILKFHSGSMSEQSASLVEVCPAGTAEINLKDLKALGLRDGDTVNITAGNGASVQVKAKWSRRAVRGSVIVPYHFSALKLNTFTRWDQPVVKVKVEKV
jgi:predicted molibdopterin-dependent oxidoreductase YjgC